MITKNSGPIVWKKNTCFYVKVYIHKFFDKFQKCILLFKKLMLKNALIFLETYLKFYANFLTIYVDHEVWCKEEMVGIRCVLTKSYIYAN